MKKIQIDMKKNNIGMKILSVIIAILIWLLVANINDPVITKRFSDVKVEVENESALTENGYAYEIVEGDQVSFTIKGKKSIVNNMSESDFDVIADFSKLSVTDAIPIDVSAEKYDGQLEITLGNVNTMKIKKDEITKISVPVNVEINGTVADGYCIGSKLATPNLMRISGPENLLSNAKEIRAEVDVDGLSKDISTSSKPVLYDNDGNVISNSQIEMEASNIDVFITLWKTKKVKVNLTYTDKPADGYVVSSFDYEPKTLTIAAPDDELAEIDSLDLDPISLEGLSENYEENVDVSSNTFPGNAILAEDSTSIRISVKFEKKISRKITFSSSDLKVKNNGGYQLTYDKSNKYTISVEGAESLVNGLKISDFTPWINLEGLEEGNHEVSIHAKEVDGVSVVDTSDIKITLEDD